MPDVVTGELATEKAAGILSPTLSTVPVVIVGKVVKLPAPSIY